MPATTRPLLIAILVLLLSACDGDPQKAQDGAKWLQDRYLFRAVGDAGEITKIFVADAALIRMEVQLNDDARAQLIDMQTLMIQSLIARHACPLKASKLWKILGEEVALRLDLKSDTEIVASAICKPA